MSYDYRFNRLINEGGAFICTLDSTGPRSLVKIYCACGRIVDLDKKIMSVKKSLKKDLECTICRNARISMEIDILNGSDDGEPCSEEDPLW